MTEFTDTRGLPVLEAFPKPIDGGYFIATYPPFAYWDRDDVVVTCEGLLRVDQMLPLFYLPVHRPTGFTRFATPS